MTLGARERPVASAVPRIVGVTDSAALVIALTCLQIDADVICQPTSEPLPADGVDDLLVLDLGSTAAGLETLERLECDAGAATGQQVRAVVIGDEEPLSQVTAHVSVLLRPYTFPQLQEAVEGHLEPQGDAAGTSDDPSLPDEPSAPEVAVAGGEGPTRQLSLTRRLFGRVAAGERAPTQDGEAPPPIAPDDAPATTLVPPDVTAPEEHAAAPEHAGTEDPAPLSPATEAADRSTRTIDLTRPTVSDMTTRPGAQVGAVDTDRQRAHRWFARRQRRGSDGEERLKERLAAVLAATSELERLLEEMPLLASAASLAEAIVEDLRQQLDAGTVALWRRVDVGHWEVLAHRGLTPLEATWHIPGDQPLFSEVDASGGALLIDPVDAVQAAVSGIGGAHTETFMAASIAAGPGRYGLLTVGRDRPLTEPDLDLLVEEASDAAPGMAVAEQLARFRSASETTVQGTIVLPEPLEPRSWRRD
jgi:hypothetical protein